MDIKVPAVVPIDVVKVSWGQVLSAVVVCEETTDTVVFGRLVAGGTVVFFLVVLGLLVELERPLLVTLGVVNGLSMGAAVLVVLVALQDLQHMRWKLGSEQYW